MNPTSALSSLQNSNPLRAILWAGFTSGTLDVSAALVVYQYFGRPPMRLLQGIPAGVLGSRSFQGGLPAALLGLFCHFFHRISCRYRLSYGEPLDTFPSGARRNLWCFLWRGCLLLHESRRGALSGAIKYPFSSQMLVVGVVIHIRCVGLPIALVVRRCSMQ